MTKDVYQPWSPGEPNGETIENCAVLRRNEQWNDLFCEALTCAICDMKAPPIFEMRGSCYGTAFDAHYGWTGQMDPVSEKYSFRYVFHNYVYKFDYI